MPCDGHSSSLIGRVPHGWSSEEVALLCLWGQGGLQSPAFAQSRGMSNNRGMRSGRPCGDMRGCCRHEPRPLISQRKREVQSGDDACPGSHSQSRAASGLLGNAPTIHPCLCVSQTLSESQKLLSLNPLSSLWGTYTGTP